jgi:hypothetical protein
MNDHPFDISPQTLARVGGALYLFIIVAALFGEVSVRGSLIVWGDAAATAANIVGSETLFRLGLAGEMLTCVCDVALSVILYVLLKPAGRVLALLAAAFRLTFVAVYGISKLFEGAALVALGGDGALSSFGPQQLHSLAYLSLRVHSYGYGVSLLFFGVCCVLFGCLIHRSGYIPRVIGVLLVVGGAGYVIFSLTQILSPPLAARVLFPWIMLPAFPAELGLSLWLLVKGVDAEKWTERARCS